MGSSKSGKPRYTPEVHAKVVKALGIGAYKLHAARAAGISLGVLDKWLKKGRAGDERYQVFARECDAAMADHAIRLQSSITKAALTAHAGDWKAAAWDLERRFPAIYGRKAEPAVGVQFGGGAAGGGGDGEGEDGQQPLTRVEFYIPDNGRRPIEET